MLRSATATALAVLVCSLGSLPAPAGSAPPRPAKARSGSLCQATETVVFSCKVRTKLASVCLGKASVHYRFGRAGHVEANVSNTADWSNIALGGNRSQGGLNQDHVRFTDGEIQTIIHSGETGSLNERPGRQRSGVVVLGGPAGETELASLDCRPAARFRNIEALRSIGPVRDEVSGSPFDLIY